MTIRATRILLFLGFWLLFPWPLSVAGEFLVPAVRFVLLAGVTFSLCVSEGFVGPTPMILGLFAFVGLATTLACILLAWLAGRTLVRVGPGMRTAIVCGVLLVALLWALLFEPYQTPMGRQPRGSLIEVLS